MVLTDKVPLRKSTLDDTKLDRANIIFTIRSFNVVLIEKEK